jgi:hypothetical protein
MPKVSPNFFQNGSYSGTPSDLVKEMIRGKQDPEYEYAYQVFAEQCSKYSILRLDLLYLLDKENLLPLR